MGRPERGAGAGRPAPRRHALDRRRPTRAGRLGAARRGLRPPHDHPRRGARARARPARPAPGRPGVGRGRRERLGGRGVRPVRRRRGGRRAGLRGGRDDPLQRGATRRRTGGRRGERPGLPRRASRTGRRLRRRRRARRPRRVRGTEAGAPGRRVRGRRAGRPGPRHPDRSGLRGGGRAAAGEPPRPAARRQPPPRPDQPGSRRHRGTPVIGVVTAPAAGRAMAHRLAEAWPGEVTVHSGPVAEQLAVAWRESDVLVCFLATGATVRLLAPLLAGKHSDPGVVCVDDAGGHATARLGGHAGGATALAARGAAVLGARPVATTASDAIGGTALDSFGADLGFRLPDRTNLARVGRAVLDGSVRLLADATWPVPALPLSDEGPVIAITDRTGVDADLVYRPPSLVVGVGASRGAPAAEIADLIAAGLADAGLARESVCALATVDLKATEPGIVEVAETNGWPLRTFPAEELAGVAVPHPSEVVRAAVGTPSVAEAAALLAAGTGAALVLPKRIGAMATVAVARLVPRGRLTIVGLGPGAGDLRGPRATAALRRAAVVVGLDQYVDQVRHLLRPGTLIVESRLGAEEERARTAVELATQGHAVALIGSGDAGVYAMASPALQLAGPDVDVEG